MLDFFVNHILVPWESPGVLWGPIVGPNRGTFSKLHGPGPLGSKGYPHTSFNYGIFSDTYASFHIGVVTKVSKTGQSVGGIFR